MNQTERSLLERAIEVAVVSHAGQMDKNEEPYILDPLRVMLTVREHGGSVAQQAAAVLHDVIEDCDIPDGFLEQRFPTEVCDMVDALTTVGTSWALRWWVRFLRAVLPVKSSSASC
jgi:guanosine-3',5'-bis(diphosphate) 3'-pyrophosphohydrolase